jgi:hypothetical protein
MLALIALSQTPVPAQNPANPDDTKKASTPPKRNRAGAPALQTPEPTLIEPTPLPAEIKPKPPKQPTLAQPAPAAPALAQPSTPGATLVRPAASRDALAPATPEPTALAPNAVAPASLSQPRAIEASGTPTRPMSDATALGQAPPPPLALPSVLQSSQPAPPPTPPPAAPVAVTPGQVQKAAAAPRKFTFIEQSAESTYDDAKFATKIVIRTTVAMQPVSIAITCDAEVLHGGVQSTAQMAGLRDGRLYQDKRVYWLVYEDPAFEVRRTLTVVLMSDNPIHVLSVNEGPALH